MKKIILAIAIIGGLLLLLGAVFSITGFALLGYDEDGYNYNSHAFKGEYCTVYPTSLVCAIDSTVKLSMKWNEAYISKDLDENGEIIRHEGFENYVGSGATLSKKYKGKYINPETNESCTWSASLRTAAAPEGATLNLTDRYWYTKDGEKIAPRFGEYGMMAIQIVNNDDCFELSGIQFSKDGSSGLGLY